MMLVRNAQRKLLMLVEMLTMDLKNDDEIVSVADALEICLEYQMSLTNETIRDWCKKYKIGKKIVGRWAVSKRKLEVLLEGRYCAKEKKDKRRKTPVRPY
eukprot:GHVO01055411.1.p1 GENE.GHVO01055411.1~~GHVO01055411.1.p1  ORF type:complete len:100 (-),score=8.13 GHVO01055411.1:223-522(-)